MPPESLALAFTPNIVPAEQLPEHAPIGETADAVTLTGELHDLKTADPHPLIAVAHIDLGARGKGGPCVRIRCRPPAGTHSTIVLMPGPRW